MTIEKRRSKLTAVVESIFLTGVIDAKEGCDVMSGDIPNPFIQVFVPNDEKDGSKQIIMKITGALVDALLEIAPEVYGPYVVFKNGKRVIYVQVLRALYGM